jgi:hypothetical protein
MSSEFGTAVFRRRLFPQLQRLKEIASIRKLLPETASAAKTEHSSSFRLFLFSLPA